jgi:hypothetical protein
VGENKGVGVRKEASVYPQLHSHIAHVIALLAYPQQQKESGGGGLLGRLISSGGLPMSWTHVLAPLANGNTAAS